MLQPVGAARLVLLHASCTFNPFLQWLPWYAESYIIQSPVAIGGMLMRLLSSVWSAQLFQLYPYMGLAALQCCSRAFTGAIPPSQTAAAVLSGRW